MLAFVLAIGFVILVVLNSKFYGLFERQDDQRNRAALGFWKYYLQWSLLVCISLVLLLVPVAIMLYFSLGAQNMTQNIGYMPIIGIAIDICLALWAFCLALGGKAKRQGDQSRRRWGLRGFLLACVGVAAFLYYSEIVWVNLHSGVALKDIPLRDQAILSFTALVFWLSSASALLCNVLCVTTAEINDAAAEPRGTEWVSTSVRSCCGPDNTAAGNGV